ncbi:DUF4184 family protein [Paenibacillus montanisoli]|uniref:DUF4184 domain-containing protein n=1 Tax=Paenibacillus montanisoli TaxID=2081970 RepID=A0A328U0I1_9BACL|nr:DUF4184 family protein [Paenibacillus montanisoli]RAP76179.1 DUF4184 domain-containing protein [Paenibacillus montanisoli]
MPFTFSHPFFAAPLRRIAPKWVSLTGLVLGSMSPDMEYFMAMEPYQSIGHSLLGFLVQGLPLGIAFAFAFHCIVKPVLPKFLPAFGRLDQFAKALCAEWRLRSFQSWLIFLVSLYIGYLTHMFMDAWTHASGIFVESFPILHSRIGGRALYQNLQFGFSIIGLAIPGICLLMRYRQFRRTETYKQRIPVASRGTKAVLWFVAVSVALLLFLLKDMFIIYLGFIGIFIVAPMSSALFGCFVASLLYLAKQRGRMAGAMKALALLTGTMAALRIGVFLREILLTDGVPYQFVHPPKGVLDPLWTVFLWGWSIALLYAVHAMESKPKAIDNRTDTRMYEST